MGAVSVCVSGIAGSRRTYRREGEVTMSKKFEDVLDRKPPETKKTPRLEEKLAWPSEIEDPSSVLFEPISYENPLDLTRKKYDAVLFWRDRGKDIAYFIKDGECSRFDVKAGKVENDYPKKITDEWPGLPFESIDAGFVWKNKAYFFNGEEYIIYNLAGSSVIERKSLDSKVDWPSKFRPVDASILYKGEALIFKDEEYIRCNPDQLKVESEPIPIRRTWSDLAEQLRSIDAAVAWNNGKAYFFKGNGYISYDIPRKGSGSLKLGPTTPSAIADWPGWPESFIDIDAGFMWPDISKPKAYFFKGDQLIRFDMLHWHVDSGYPKKVKDEWLELHSMFAPPYDTAFTIKNVLYLFKGSECLRWDLDLNQLIPFSIPIDSTGRCEDQPTKRYYHLDFGVPVVDAALLWGDMIYFFKDDKCIKYNKNRGAEPGYPKRIKDEWEKWPDHFIPVDAAVNVNGNAYFFKGDKYIQYNKNKKQETYGQYTSWNSGNWPKSAKSKSFRIHAGFMGPSPGSKDPNKNDMVYFFDGDEIIGCDMTTPNLPDPKVTLGPTITKSLWGDWPFSPDACLTGNGEAFAFWKQYYNRWNFSSNKIDNPPNEPRHNAYIHDGLPDTRLSLIDAAISDGSRYAYFFKGDEVIKYDSRQDTAGGSMKIKKEWPKWPDSFTSVDAAINYNDFMFIFKGNKYCVYDRRGKAVYGPKKIINWPLVN